MSINIFSGSGNASKKTSSSRNPATSSAAARAAATTSALGSGAIASDSGSTAVQSNGVLGKIGGFLNKVSGVAQYMPGIVGKIGSVVHQLTSANDPEWWNTVPGDGLTCNDPLQVLDLGYVDYPPTQQENLKAYYDFETDPGGSVFPEYTEHTKMQIGVIRPTFLELLSTDGALAEPGNFVIEPSSNMIVQYLLPQIRTVTNAVYLQDAVYYKKALQVQATMYALWRQFKKIDFFLKHGKSFVPNTNEPAFPIFQVENASYLQSLITRLEEYLHANVRLPHTLCEYLAWRFGRVYRINSSAKAAFVMYNVLPISHSIGTINSWISWLQGQISSTEQVQKAAADIYNAYCDHDQEVLIADDNVIAYDSKEFVLRTNLDLKNEARLFSRMKLKNNILMDSNLDNPTTFMASTISCQPEPSYDALFPVYVANVYAYFNGSETFYAKDGVTGIHLYHGLGGTTTPPGVVANTVANFGSALSQVEQEAVRDVSFNKLANGSVWYRLIIRPGVLAPTPEYTDENYWGSRDRDSKLYADFCLQIAMCKAMEFYNVGFYIPFAAYNTTAYITQEAPIWAHDCTSIAQDSGLVADTIIENEQVLAFANLMTVEHKDKTTYRQVERRVARDLANTIEQIPVASVAK